MIRLTKIRDTITKRAFSTSSHLLTKEEATNNTDAQKESSPGSNNIGAQEKSSTGSNNIGAQEKSSTDSNNLVAAEKSFTGTNNLGAQEESSTTSNPQSGHPPRNNLPVLHEDPFTSYGDSPIPADVEGSTADLIETYHARQSDLITDKKAELLHHSEKSKMYLSELINDRDLDRSNLEGEDLKNYDRETRGLIKDESAAVQTELQTIIVTRDDVLSALNFTRRYSGSEYDSDYVSVTSKNRLNAEFNAIDAEDDQVKQNHNEFAESLLQRYPSVDSENENNSSELSSDSPKSENESTSNEPVAVEAGPSNYFIGSSMGDTGTFTGKRKREESESDNNDESKKS